MNTGEEIKYSNHGLLTTAAWKLGPEAPMNYAVEGAVFCAGASVQWLRDGLELFENAPDIENLAKQVENSGDVSLFAYTVRRIGERMLEVLSLSPEIRRRYLARATLEGIALYGTRS